MAKIFLQSLGCDKNTVDAEKMAYLITGAGHTMCASANEADCAIINTCGFIEAAKQEAIECIFDAVRCKEQGTLRAVVVTGCLAQRYAEEMPKLIPEADAVVTLADACRIVEVIDTVLSGKRWQSEPCAPLVTLSEGERLHGGAQHYAYLKIADGCDNFCTFCAIPSIRGHYTSRPSENLVVEARVLAQQGAKELILIAQDTTRYGTDRAGELDISGLILKLAEIPQLHWIRLLYAYPDGLTDRLVSTFAQCKKLVPYIDIPLQHCNEQVLKRMGRKITDSAEINRRISMLQAAVPDIAVRTTFIAGFPGETKEQFLQLCEFARQMGFARAGCFAYSREEGTAAYRLDGQIRSDVRRKRADSLNLILYEGLLARQRAMVGNTLEAVCDGYSEERGQYILRSVYDAPDIDTLVYASSKHELSCGDFCTVQITNALNEDLEGTVCE